MRKYCEVCKQYHELVVKKIFVEECTEEDYEEAAHWVKTYHWKKKDRIEMLTHKLLTVGSQITKTELQIERYEREEKKVKPIKKSSPGYALIPIYVDPFLISKIHLPMLKLERDLIKKMLAEETSTNTD